MDANVIMTAVSTLGFPIVMCGALFWKMVRQDTLHKEEQEKLTTAINNNTLVMQKFIDGSGVSK